MQDLKKTTTDESLMTHERLEMMQVSALCRYFSLFLVLNCKFVCVKHSEKKNRQFFHLKNKITTEFFALFTHVNCVYKMQLKRKKNLLALVCYSHRFVTVRHLTHLELRKHLTVFISVFLEATRISRLTRAPLKTHRTNYPDAGDPKWRLIHRFPLGLY